ncbi:MAG: hypothetical protein M9950_10260 [Thermomicrobiales bacterium]|nr:hypothetical protein [Thermomicrobiales bacterium]
MARGCVIPGGSLVGTGASDVLKLLHKSAMLPVVPAETPVTPSPTVTPTETPTVAPTETPGGGDEGDVEHTVVIQLNGIEAAGSAFGVYSPSASNLPVGALYTGVVTDDNTITIPDLLPGDYKVVIDHPERGLVSFSITVDAFTGDVQLLEVDLSEDEEAGGSETETTTPTAEAVTSLPSAGTGESGIGSQMTQIWLVATCGLVLTSLRLGLHRNRS